MHQLRDLLGKEHPLDTVNRTLRDFARAQRPAAVGALHVVCSDESERECADSFQQWFADELLPELKFSSKTPFRTTNLGARYEWGSLPIAEHHFALPETSDDFKLLLVKLNSHVAVDVTGGRVRYGHMDRYGSDSAFCGALHALLDGNSLPAVASLREVFTSEGKDRIAILNDPQRVEPKFRSLLAAVVNTRLQARRAVLDIQNHAPATPTLFLVLPCVTFNRKQRDSELVVGVYTADYRGTSPTVRYHGLGDDPGHYRVREHHGYVHIEDNQFHQDRDARDHRELIARQWRNDDPHSWAGREQLDEVMQLTRQATAQPGDNGAVSRAALQAALPLLAAMAPVPTSIMLFAYGLAGIHQVYRAYRLVNGKGDVADAQAIINEVCTHIDKLPPEKAQQAVQWLGRHYDTA